MELERKGKDGPRPQGEKELVSKKSGVKVRQLWLAGPAYRALSLRRAVTPTPPISFPTLQLWTNMRPKRKSIDHLFKCRCGYQV